MATKTNFLSDYSLEYDFNIEVDDNLYILNQHGLEVEDVINLAGGIPCLGVNNGRITIETSLGNVIKVYIRSREFEITRTIDLEEKIIQNDSMVVTNTGNGLGTFMFVNQVIAARRLEFRRLEVSALGGSDTGFERSWNGYYTWGRVGYLMGKKDGDRFKGWLKQSSWDFQYLHEVLDDEKGNAAWTKSGFMWDGYFDLSDESLSIEILQKYLLKRGINVSL